MTCQDEDSKNVDDEEITIVGDNMAGFSSKNLEHPLKKRIR
jgi:hypothetical protein